MSNQALRFKVKQLYKTVKECLSQNYDIPKLLHLGKEYPKGSDYFRKKLHAVFMKNKDVTDPKEIELLIAKGEYIVKELESLYMLRKYRTLKKRYYDSEH